VAFDVSPPRSLNEFGTQGEPAYSTTNPPPAAAVASNTPSGGLTFAVAPAGANDPDFLSAQDVWNKAVADETQASAQAGQLYNDFRAAQAAAASDLTGQGNARVTATGQAYDTALRALANATTAKETAGTKMHDADVAAASRAKDPDLKNYYQAHAEQAQAAAALSKAQGAALTAKTPEDIKNVQAQTAEASARAASLNMLTPAQAAQANQQANLYGAQAQQINTLLPFLGREEKAKATIAEAGAGLAVPTAQASLDKAQADADKARADVNETTRRIAAMPTEQQAQAAIDLGLKDKQADLDAKSLQLEQAKKLMPIAVGQAGANVAATEAGTAATLAGIGQKTLGPLYGIGDQISRYRDMIATGQINPQDADTALNSYLNTQVQGATPYQIGQEQNRYAEAMRQQDIGLTENRLNAAQQYAGNVLGQYAQMAASAGPGHGQEAAQAYLDTLQQGQRFFGQMGGMVTPPTVPSAVSQAPVVHINIGGGQPTSASQPTDVMAGLPAAPPPLPAMTAAPPPAPSGMPVFGGPAAQPYNYQYETGAASQARNAGEGEQAPVDAMEAHQARWADELASGAVTMPGEQQPQEATT